MPADEPLDLFERERPRARALQAPLADRMRPRSLEDVLGQAHLVGPGAPLRTLVESGSLPSLVLWGPPGSGKTTLARLLAAGPGQGSGPPRVRFVPLSAVLAGVKDVRAVVERAAREQAAGVRTVLFLDEIHRFHRGQQDALLPHVEHGTVTLIGATTENPCFELAPPLLSRCRVFVLRRLDAETLAALVRRAATDAERGLGASGVRLDEEAVAALVDAADGDARRALGLLESAVSLWQRGPRDVPLAAALVGEASGQRVLVHDRDREEHYNVISALIKSLRASDPDAGLYWLARLLEAGEDPCFVARRLVVFAAEDVGNAEPQALSLATAAHLAAERIGMPEARIPLAQAVAFLACAPKSNAAYAGLERARRDVRDRGSLPVPLHLRNAPTPLLRELGYGRGYRDPHHEPGGFVADPNLPPELGTPHYYEPGEAGAERSIRERLSAWRARRAAPGEDPERS